jgi:hypothetical protein
MNCVFLNRRGNLGLAGLAELAFGIERKAVSKSMLESGLPGRITRLVLPKAPRKLRELGEESRILRNWYFQKSVIS